MTDKSIKIKRALLSVSDKTGLLDLAKVLEDLNIEIISTGGTLKALSDGGIAAKDISEFSGSPEMMQGRVKTLHPMVHGGILSRRELDSEEVKNNNIQEIDLVVVNLYPFEETIKKKDVLLNEAIENIDIGGPTMIRAAAKNFHHVAVISSPNSYTKFSKELLDTKECSFQTRLDLAIEAFQLITKYDQAISNYLGNSINNVFPNSLFGKYQKTESLRYGENPHQEAAFYKELKKEVAGISSSVQLQGKELSYNNIADTDAAIECVSNFDEPTCVIVKHANPCGVASSSSPLEAYKKAFACDPTSAFGGIISFNTNVDESTASFMIDNQFIEVIAAPSYSDKALEVLASKKNIRVLRVANLKTLSSGVKLHTVNSGLLLQSIDAGSIKESDLKIVTEKKASSVEINNSLFAWKVCKYVKSNAIIYANNNQTLGIGAGQMSRIDSAEIAVKKATKAGFSLKGACMASDAFFPFRDSIDEAAKNGISCIIQPGGSIRDDEVIEAANEANIIMMFTGMRHFRH
jgi:phosphoribosylaminoimidazolecarboxamide formyltransferase/IMP cyclohydrolase